MHAASVLNALDSEDIDYHCYGMGGEKLASAGMQLLVDFSDVAVMGYVDVIANYRKLHQRLGLLQQSLETRRPDLLVLVDYAGFNLKLAEHASKLNIPVLYYISPKVWASKPQRMQKIAQFVTHAALIFPFEVDLYKKAGVPATYVGNPLLDQIKTAGGKPAAREQLESVNNLPAAEPQTTWVGLIPGSRQSEIRYNLPVMLRAARQLQQERDEPCRFLLPLASSIKRSLVTPLIENEKANVEIIDQQAHRVMEASDSLLVCSGTATLEAAVLGTPMVTLYVTGWLNYQILKRMVISDYITLVNIQANQPVVRELIQHEATVEALVAETRRLLDDKQYRADMQSRLNDITAAMQGRQQHQATPGSSPVGGASSKTANLVVQLLQANP